MRSALIVLLFGVAFTATVFFLVSSAPDSPAMAEQSVRPPHETTSADTSTLIPEVAETDATPAPSATETEILDGATNSIANELVPLSVPIPISRPPTPVLIMADGTEVQAGSTAMSEVHSEIEHEPIDSAWASISESALYDFYAQNPALTENFYALAIQCRSTLCLIQAVGNDAQSRGIWSREMRKLFEQPRADQFGKSPFAVEIYVTPEGQMAYLWYLKKRAPEESQLQSVTSVASAI